MNDSKFASIQLRTRELKSDHVGLVMSLLSQKIRSNFYLMAQVLEVSQVGRILNTSLGLMPIYVHSNNDVEREASSFVKSVQKSAGQVKQVGTGTQYFI